MTHPRTAVCCAVIAAGILGVLTAHFGRTNLGLGLVGCALPLLPVLFLRPVLAATVAIALLPFEMNVLGASALGLNVAPSDILLSVALAGLLFECVRDRRVRARFAALRPLAVPCGYYVLTAVVVIAAHPSLRGVVRLSQRFEVVGIAAIAGCCLLTERTARRALLLFVAAAIVLAGLWLFNDGSPALLGGQKNPSGQFLTDAALITVVTVKGRIRIPILALLVFGLYATQSRGALIGLVAGLAVLVVLNSRDPIQVVVRSVIVLSILFGFYKTLPHNEQLRLLGDTKAAQYNDEIRVLYARDARRVIREHPVLGVGIGNYLEGNAAILTLTDDPHDVLLLEAAEGGYLLLAGFIVLQLGTTTVLLRRRRASWVPLALAVQVAILSHAVVDIYWVRGTPTPEWLLVGLALGSTAVAPPGVASLTPGRAAVASGAP